MFQSSSWDYYSGLNDSMKALGDEVVHVAAILLAPMSPRVGEREALTEVGGANT